MTHINKEALRFMASQVDWNAIMLDLVSVQPDTVAELLNTHFETGGTAGQADQAALSVDLASELDIAFTHVARAVNAQIEGRITTADKLFAIQRLRNAFDLDLRQAEEYVNIMMDRYREDPCYYPKAETKTAYKFR